MEEGSILFEPEAENHYFGSFIETARSNHALARQPPVNNRYDARVAGDAVNTERTMSAIEGDPASKSAAGGSMIDT